MKKRKIRKAFGHKWYDHLFYKYKYVEAEKEYKEYEKFRVWLVIVIWISLVLTSPIVMLISLISESKAWFKYPTGWDDNEKYTSISKEEVE